MPRRGKVGKAWSGARFAPEDLGEVVTDAAGQPGDASEIELLAEASCRSIAAIRPDAEPALRGKGGTFDLRSVSRP
jgi:hypothetical protein